MSKKDSSSLPAIEVTGISKCYTINHKNKASYSTLKDDLANIVRAPLGKKIESTEEKFWALKNVSFEVPKGEIFGVIGKNGSGKSTLLKILSRIVDPTEGSIKIRGRVASLLEVGTGFHPELTGRENIYFNGSMLGMSRQEITSKFQEIVDFSEIEKFIDTPVKFYSSGMYVRLAFAVAAHLDPEILILDEVLAVGDAAFQQKSMKKILSTMTEGRTVLFVSHSMGAIRQLCTKGVLLKEGTVEASGSIGAITDRYLLETMNEGEEATSELSPTWVNNGSVDSEWFVPEEISLVDADQKPLKGVADRNEDAWVSIKGTIKKTDPAFTLGYALWDKDSRNMLYMSLATDGSQKDWPKFNKGPVQILGKIPRRLLNTGNYRVTVVDALFQKYWIHDPEASPMRVGLKVDGKYTSSPYWLDNRGGIIAPEITDWKNA
ncbi:MAG: ABC transporter ATP-binding protein [Candidatus Saccharibacteria bacterium]|nr:ABC transporter ATP-binding protein [Candidatus Saccharibacteria bacterium]